LAELYKGTLAMVQRCYLMQPCLLASLEDAIKALLSLSSGAIGAPSRARHRKLEIAIRTASKDLVNTSTIWTSFLIASRAILGGFVGSISTSAAGHRPSGTPSEVKSTPMKNVDVRCGCMTCSRVAELGSLRAAQCVGSAFVETFLERETMELRTLQLADEIEHTQLLVKLMLSFTRRSADSGCEI